MGFVDDDPLNSLSNPDFTYHKDKYSCLRTAYFAHVFFSYMMMFSGIGAFATRILPLRFRPLHRWCGRAYIMSMLWACGTSIVMHNTGLPAAILISLAYVAIGLCVGWVAIHIHMSRVASRALSNVQVRIKALGIAEGGLEQMLVDEKERMAAARPLWERFISLKTLHGVLMFWSWINITGRVFSSNQSGDFTCHTYPVYKPIDTREGTYSQISLEDRLVDPYDTSSGRRPWSRSLTAWALQLAVGPIFGALIVAFLWSFFTSSRFRTRAVYEFDGSVVQADVGRADGPEGFEKSTYSTRKKAAEITKLSASRLAAALNGGHNSEVGAQTFGGQQNLDPNHYYT
mmetsp:Transcript_10448/g.20547  ORF Transcript_10448/g.20547 Transcript_10448/m.20547 type:complete len:344 (-) Transcript_10448:386-1417(-)|eukprot:CAMPEP_0173408822 /NCGR_PEP_ID=MMETSP1356-20130122/70686_1 /TAXON_ID=77927 ORGANISM="Hemiselmis virescens, Strain PCC157" /NCGR_SAMPLE_ID=MMETSP1356 /ASSEMBLY_ACC=CAM_ASM_000847 /LENGTH=343 /DNA_ID=CAMNT_0014370185 /DNA_START=146 /DNA_END=1177 /DNA_ORIENTATION=-